MPGSTGMTRFASGGTGVVYVLAVNEKQTPFVVRRLRERLGDKESIVYPQDDPLAQTLLDLFPRLAKSVEAAEGVAPRFVDVTDAEDPLATAPSLTSDQCELWALLAAQVILEGEKKQAARIAGNIQTPAGRMNTERTWEAIASCLADVERALDEYLNDGLATLVFGDLTVLDGRVLEPDEL